MTAFAVASCWIATTLIADPSSQQAVRLSAALATMNGVCALLLAYVGATRKSTKAFFGAVLGGMVLRMATMLGGFMVGLKVLMLPALPFAVALLGYTGLFTAAEVALWSRQNFSSRVQLS